MNGRTVIFTLVALALGVTAGRFAGRNTQATSPVQTAPKLPGTPAAAAIASSAIAGESPAISRVFTALHGARSDERSDLYEAVQLLSPEEIEKVRDALNRMPSSVVNLLRPSLLEQWARHNPAEAALHVREMPDGGRFDDKDGVAYAWAQTNPEQALAEAGRLGSKSGKATYLRKVAIGFLAQRDPSMAMDHVEALRESPEKESLLTTTATELARKNPEAASTWLASRLPRLKVGAEGSALVDRMLAAMVRKDPIRAKAEVARLPDLLRESAARTVGGELVAHNVRPGLEWCAENAVFSGRSADSSGGPFATALARDPETALAWTLEQPAGDSRDAGLGQLIPASKNAEEISRYFSMMSVKAQSDCLEDTIAAYGKMATFGETARWASSISDEKVRTEAISSLIAEKVEEHPEEVISWLDTMPASSAREQGALAALQFNGPDPKTAGRLLGYVSNAESKEAVAVHLYRMFIDDDEKKSIEWLRGMPGFTPQQKAAIRKRAMEGDEE